MRIVQRLKARARVNGRSLELEIQEILERAAGLLTMCEAGKLSERWRRGLSRRSFPDNARLIREDRDSRIASAWRPVEEIVENALQAGRRFDHDQAVLFQVEVAIA
jgi:hypothetical protein